MDNIYTLNTHEKIPKYFYVFSNRNPKPLINQSAQHNIKLRHGTLVSSGVNNIFTSEEQREKFKNGDLEYLLVIPARGNRASGRLETASPVFEKPFLCSEAACPERQ